LQYTAKTLYISSGKFKNWNRVSTDWFSPTSTSRIHSTNVDKHSLVDMST
jgi:hypothetical protein